MLRVCISRCAAGETGSGTVRAAEEFSIGGMMRMSAHRFGGMKGEERVEGRVGSLPKGTASETRRDHRTTAAERSDPPWRIRVVYYIVALPR